MGGGCVDYSPVAASLFVGLWWWFTAWVAGFLAWLFGCVGVVCELDSVFVCFLCLFFVFECFWLGLLAGFVWLVGFSGL